jgi:hypothetical protein
MANEQAPSAEEREDLLRAGWLSHDARWYAAAVDDVGTAAANRLNRRAIRHAAMVEARRLHRVLGSPPVGTAREFLDFADQARELFVGDRVELCNEVIDTRTYRVEVKRCFAAEQVERAGLASSYECGIFDRIQGWHEALRVPLSEDVPTTTCLLANGERCERTIRMRVEAPEIATA